MLKVYQHDGCLRTCCFASSYIFFQAYEILSDPQKREIYDQVKQISNILVASSSTRMFGQGGEEAIQQGGGRGGGGEWDVQLDVSFDNHPDRDDNQHGDHQ